MFCHLYKTIMVHVFKDAYNVLTVAMGTVLQEDPLKLSFSKTT